MTIIAFVRIGCTRLDVRLNPIRAQKYVLRHAHDPEVLVDLRTRVVVGALVAGAVRVLVAGSLVVAVVRAVTFVLIVGVARVVTLGLVADVVRYRQRCRQQ